MLTSAMLPETFFNKGFGFGLVKLDVKTRSCSSVEFSTSGSSNTDTGKVSGTLETKYKWCEYGLTFTEKWNTDNSLRTEIAIQDQICQGLKLTSDTTFSPNTGKKSGKIKSAYKRECINLGCDVDFDFAGPAIHGLHTHLLLPGGLLPPGWLRAPYLQSRRQLDRQTARLPG